MLLPSLTLLVFLTTTAASFRLVGKCRVRPVVNRNDRRARLGHSVAVCIQIRHNPAVVGCVPHRLIHVYFWFAVISGAL
jgi:hypothetical protein